MSWQYAIDYLLKQNWRREEESTTGTVSVVRMTATPPAHPYAGADSQIVLEIVCDSDGRPQAANLRTVQNPGG